MRSEDFLESLRSFGIERGDVVLVHSSISRIMKLINESQPGFAIRELLDLFLESVGRQGTLLLPLFNFDFCDGRSFDYRHTPSRMGALTELARCDVRFVRTCHPVYSFAVSGARAKDFAALTNVSALGADGPFGLLYRMKGKILVLDLDDQNSMTMYHHVEEVLEVDYRFSKSFTGQYRDADGNIDMRTYSVFVRNREQGVQTDVNRAGELLWERGLYRGDRPHVRTGVRVIGAVDFFDTVKEIIQSGTAQRYLYSIDVADSLTKPQI